MFVTFINDLFGPQDLSIESFLVDIRGNLAELQFFFLCDQWFLRQINLIHIYGQLWFLLFIKCLYSLHLVDHIVALFHYLLLIRFLKMLFIDVYHLPGRNLS